MLDEDHAVTEFVEKPTSDRSGPNLISAGAYVLEREILDLVPPGRNVSIEREVWPLLVGDGLYGFPSERYWMDIGTPARYLQGTFDIIEGNVRTAVLERLGGDWLAVDEGASIDGRVIPPALIGRGSTVAAWRPRGQPGRARSRRHDRRRKRRRARRAARRGHDRRGLRAARLHPGTRRARSGTTPRSPAERCSARASTVGSGNVISRGARIFPGVRLPDGAIEF